MLELVSAVDSCLVQVVIISNLLSRCTGPRGAVDLRRRILTPGNEAHGAHGRVMPQEEDDVESGNVDAELAHRAHLCILHCAYNTYAHAQLNARLKSADDWSIVRLAAPLSTSRFP